MESQVKACPTCHQEPEVVKGVNHQVTLICARHGHMAMGDDHESAIHHWNMYVLFLGKAA